MPSQLVQDCVHIASDHHQHCQQSEEKEKKSDKLCNVKVIELTMPKKMVKNMVEKMIN